MLGVFTTPALSMALDKMGLAENSESMWRYRNIVTKEGSYDGLALKRYNNQDTKMKDYLQTQLASRQDDKVKEKYENTFDYCKYIVSLGQQAGSNL